MASNSTAKLSSTLMRRAALVVGLLGIWLSRSFATVVRLPLDSIAVS